MAPQKHLTCVLQKLGEQQHGKSQPHVKLLSILEKLPTIQYNEYRNENCIRIFPLFSCPFELWTLV